MRIVDWSLVDESADLDDNEASVLIQMDELPVSDPDAFLLSVSGDKVVTHHSSFTASWRTIKPIKV